MLRCCRIFYEKGETPNQTKRMTKELLKDMVMNLGYFFLYRHEKICCGYSLEAPQRGASNEYPQHMFLWKTREKYPRIIIKYSSLAPPPPPPHTHTHTPWDVQAGLDLRYSHKYITLLVRCGTWTIGDSFLFYWQKSLI